MKVDKKNIFITGATGFVGAWLVRYFAQLGWSVTASGRGAAPAPLLACAQYIQADLRQSFPLVETDVVVHAAALASDSASMADLYAANVEGTRHVFEATRHCRMFIYISSASVYDYQNTIHTEDEPVDYQQLSLYGRSKRQAEEWLLQQDWRERTLVILRPRAVYGPGDRVLLPRLLRLVKGNRIVSPGDMRIQSSLTHVENLCMAVMNSIIYFEKQPGGVHIFNVADKVPYDMRKVVVQLLPAVCGRTLTFRELPLRPLYALAEIGERLRIPTSFTRFGLAAVSKPCVLYLKKITETIDFQPKRNFWEALPEISDWTKQIGLADLQTANPDLPWRIDGTILPSPSK